MEGDQRFASARLYLTRNATLTVIMMSPLAKA